MGAVIDRQTDRAVLLQAFLNRHRGSRLRPGQHDCAIFAADWVRLCCGQDLAADWRGRYRTLDDGRAVLLKPGLDDPADLTARYLTGIDDRTRARTGDVAVVSENGEQAMAIVGGAFIHGLAVNGLQVVPLSRALRVFRP